MDFQNCIPIDIRTHISYRGEEDVYKAAVLADDFSVTHQAIRNQVETKSNRHVTRNTEQAQAISMPDKTVKTTNESKPKLTCYYCKKEGHLRQDCLKLKKKNESSTHKVTALVSRHSSESLFENTISNLSDDHKSQETETTTLSQMKLIEEQKKYQELSTLRETALTADEAEMEAVCER